MIKGHQSSKCETGSHPSTLLTATVFFFFPLLSGDDVVNFPLKFAPVPAAFPQTVNFYDL